MDIRREVVRLMENNPVLTKLEGDDWYSVEDSITNLLCQVTGVKDTTYFNEEIVYPSVLDKELADKPTEFEERIYRKVKAYYQFEDLQSILIADKDIGNDFCSYKDNIVQIIKDNAPAIIDKYDDTLEYDWEITMREAIDYVVKGK